MKNFWIKPKLPSEEKLKKFKDIIFGTLGRIHSISEKEIKHFIERVLAGFTKEQIYELENSPYKYSNEIKKKIINLQEKYLEEEFFKERWASFKLFLKCYFLQVFSFLSCPKKDTFAFDHIYNFF